MGVIEKLNISLNHNHYPPLKNRDFTTTKDLGDPRPVCKLEFVRYGPVKKCSIEECGEECGVYASQGGILFGSVAAAAPLTKTFRNWTEILIEYHAFLLHFGLE